MISEQQIKILQDIAKKYLERTRPYITKEGTWRNYSEDDLWKEIVYQVVVVGNSGPYKPMKESKKVQDDLNFDYLGKLSIDERQRIIHETLRNFGVRYVPFDIVKDKKTPALMKNYDFLKTYKGGPKEYFNFLSMLSDDNSRIKRFKKDMNYIKEGAPDLLASLGIVTDVIVFTIRPDNVFQEIGLNMPSNDRNNRKEYIDFQNEIINQVCRPIKITGVMLDRILYRNYENILIDIRR